MFQEESCKEDRNYYGRKMSRTHFYNVTNIAKIFWLDVRQETVSNVLRWGNPRPEADALTPLCQPAHNNVKFSHMSHDSLRTCRPRHSPPRWARSCNPGRCSVCVQSSQSSHILVKIENGVWLKDFDVCMAKSPGKWNSSRVIIELLCL